jgi:hypothetical protein
VAQPNVTTTLTWTIWLALLAFVVLDNRDLRTARAVIFLGVMLLAIWIVGALDWQYGAVAQGLIAVAATVISLAANRHLRAMDQADYRIVLAFRDLLGSMHALRGRIGHVTQPEYVEAFSALVDRFGTAQVPSEDWRTFQTDVVAHLERRVKAIREEDLSPSTSMRIDQEWAQLKERYGILYRSKSSFWRGFPTPS